MKFCYVTCQKRKEPRFIEGISNTYVITNWKKEHGAYFCVGQLWMVTVQPTVFELQARTCSFPCSGS